MTLETEIATYNAQLPHLLAHGEGKFVVIAGEKVVGIFETNEDAYTAGLEAVGVKPFLLRQILKVQPIAFLPTIMVRRKIA